jgi:hypothetical protein
VGRAARDRVVDAFDLRVAGGKLAALYEELLSGVREMAA